MAVIEKLGGEARQCQIAEAMGAEWKTQTMYALLRKTMGRMVRKYVLATPGRGVYRQHPTFHRRGLGTRDFTIRQIEKFLTERGYPAPTAAIHAACGARDLSGGTRDNEHKRVTLALAGTPETFYQPRKGTWDLTSRFSHA
jgi:hypothetical protein